MSKPNEERDIYYIPPNFLASGRLFGGMIRARNAIEACVLVLLTGIPIIKLPMSLTVRIIILCLLPLPLGIFGIIGFEGDSLSEFAINWVLWFIHRRSLYRSDVTIPETARKQKKRIWEQEATKPPEELGIRIKQPRKKRKRPTKTEKQLNKNNRKMVPSHKKQVTYSEDFVPVKDIRNGIIETEDGRYIRVLEVEPINFLLRSTSEQKNIVASFASWMKISPIKIQIKVLTKKADIGKHLNTIERDMESESRMALTYVCSPLSAPTRAEIMVNAQRARTYMTMCEREFGCRAVAPHAYLPYLLDDSNPKERALALSFGANLLALCDRLVIYGDRISSGMKEEIRRARELGIPILNRQTQLSDGSSDPVIVGRYINGISLNGLEYLKNDADEVIYFAGVEAAKVYLREHGVTEEEMEDMVFRKSVGTCFRCGDPLFLSDIPEYTCQCFRCDEDFYSIEQDVDL